MQSFLHVPLQMKELQGLTCSIQNSVNLDPSDFFSPFSVNIVFMSC